MKKICTRVVFAWTVGTILIFAVTACKTPPTQTALDVATLISEGNCVEIQAQLTGAHLSANEKGALAVCALVQNSDETGQQRALKFIASDDSTATLTQAKFTLSLAVLYPSPTADFQLAVLRTVLGASGFGPISSDSVIAPKTTEGQQLAIHLLRYAIDAYFNNSSGARLDDLVELWNGCQYLLGDTYSVESDYWAWQLFTALAELGLNVFDPFNKTDFGYAVMKATVTALEQNGAIAVAAKCDLGSPYERLKSALSKDTALLGPMERAVSVATGCSRGKYAPEEQ
ncbi:MAG: hypothetical protein JXX14_19405 [Deltaproteobacteria bacterium]|nr:hypothetical protein [Deltaproteobacteria bacterium]